MFKLSYRAKMRLKRLAIFLGISGLILLLIWICWLIWLQRYVVYTRDGVVIDFSRSSLSLEDKAATGDQQQTIAIDIQLGDSQANREPEEGLQILNGVYVDTDMLLEGVEGVVEALTDLEPGSAVLLDVKSKFGNFYYSTDIQDASLTDSIDVATMDALIADLAERDCYLIARLPAFRDSDFARRNQSSGLALSSGALWTDEDKCYWLNPASDTVQSNLIQICRELHGLGFDEVVFTDFRIPDSGNIVYSAETSKDELLKQTAAHLVTSCSNEEFVVSFTGAVDFPLPEGQTRLYLENVDPQTAEAMVAQSAAQDPITQTVFLADTRDTRFDTYCILRSLL